MYGSKARGDAGPASDVHVLALVPDAADAALTARRLSYVGDGTATVDHTVVVRTLWEAWKAEEVAWRPGGEAEPMVEDAAGWAGTAREFCGLAREAVATDGIDLDRPDESGGDGDAEGAAAS